MVVKLEKQFNFNDKVNNPNNELNIKIGSRKKGVKNPNIRPNLNNNLYNGAYTQEQKWRIYKGKVEPKILDLIKPEDTNQLLETLKRAFKETGLINIKSILEEARKDKSSIDKDIIAPPDLTKPRRTRSASISGPPRRTLTVELPPARYTPLMTPLSLSSPAKPSSYADVVSSSSVAMPSPASSDISRASTRVISPKLTADEILAKRGRPKKK